MDQRTSRHDGLIGIPVIDLRTVETCDDSALFHALRRITTGSEPTATVAGFNACLPSTDRDERDVAAAAESR